MHVWATTKYFDLDRLPLVAHLKRRSKPLTERSKHQMVMPHTTMMLEHLNERRQKIKRSLRALAVAVCFMGAEPWPALFRRAYVDVAPSPQPFVGTESKTFESYADALEIEELGSEATEAPAIAGQLMPADKPTDRLVLDDELLDVGVSSPYVVADSPAEAERLLDSLQEGALNGGPGASSSAAARVQYGPCTLTPSSVYLRTSSGKKKAVGFKPVTKCSVPVVKFTTQRICITSGECGGGIR